MMLKVKLLGQFDIQLNGAPIKVRTQSAQSLLAYLLLNAGTAQRRVKLAGLFWPDASESNARNNLRHALWRIRKAIGHDYILTDNVSVALDTDADYWLDAAVLETAVDEDGSADELIDVVAVYTGELLPGFYDDWVVLERERLKAVFEQQIKRLLDRLVQERRWDDLLHWGEHWIALGQSPEPAYRALMVAHAELGNQARVAAVYQRCVETLREDLEVEPSQETRALYERLSQGEMLFQISIDAAERERVIHLVDRDDLPAHPPAFLDDEIKLPEIKDSVFVERECELSQLDRFLHNALHGRGQLAFITGGAGRGKTTLMREFARRALVAHPELLVASGDCTAYTGVGDSYLPFRQVMEVLTGDVEVRWASGVVSRAHARRLWAALPQVVQALLEHGPYLVDILVPGRTLLSRATVAASAPDVPWLGHLREWVERPRGDTGGGEQGQIFHQFSNVLQALAKGHPLLLMLDDLQWADAASISLLFHLGQRLADAGGRILVVGAYRPEEVALGRDGERHPLEKVLAECKRRYGDVGVDLAQADRLEGRAFVDALLDSEPNRLGEDFRSALFHRTQGHPLFTVELLRVMQERGDLVQDTEGRWVTGPVLDWKTLPVRVEAVIEERVDRLDDRLRDVLTVASLEGERFTAQVVAQVQDIPERELLRTLSRELATRHRLVQAAGEAQVGGRYLSRYQFAHALYQEHLYDTLSAGERRLLHGETAAALERIYASQIEQITAQLAHHYDQAGHREKAIEYLLRAGEGARVSYANEEARAHYQRALELLGPAPGSPGGNREAMWRLAALRGLGQVHLGTGSFDEAEAYFRETIALGQELALAASELVRLYFWLSEALSYQNRLDELMGIGEKGLALLGRETGPSLESPDAIPSTDGEASVEAALMTYVVASANLMQGKRERRRKLIFRTAGILENLPYTEELVPAYANIAIVHADNKGLAEAMNWLHVLEEGAVAHHDLRGLGQAYYLAGWIMAMRGDIRGAISKFVQAVELYTKKGDTALTVWPLLQLRPAFLCLGDLQKAKEHVFPELIMGMDITAKFAHGCEGQMYLIQGSWQLALDAFLKLYQLGQEMDDIWDQALAARHLGRAYLAGGNVREAINRFQEALVRAAPEMARGRFPNFLGPFRPEAVRQNEHLLASALAGLEEAYADPEAFHAFCQRLRGEYPRFRDLAFMNWYSEPAESRDYAENLFYDAFVETLADDWVWRDPFSDCSFAVQDGLTINAANGRDLVHINLSAPRLLRPVPAANDFAAQTVSVPGSAERPAIGGLLLWVDQENYLRLDRGYRGMHEITFQGCLENKDVIIGRGLLPYHRIFLRLERVGARADALCSADGEEWFSVGSVAFPIDGPLQVGLHAIGNIDRTIYHGAYPDGAAIRFESFMLWES